HWVSAQHAVPCTVRVYDRLFDVESPTDIADLNPDSLVEIHGCQLEPAAAHNDDAACFQFERQGYFSRDTIDSKPDALVFNRTITLRDTWAKLQADDKPAEQPKTKAKPQIQKAEEALPPDVQRRADQFAAAGAATADARRMALTPTLGRLFEEARSHSKHAAAVAKWIVNEVVRHPAVLGEGATVLDGKSLAELVDLVEGGTINGTAGKEVLAEMIAT